MTFDPRIAIVANGAHPDSDWLAEELQTFHTIIAVDGGIHVLDACNITPKEAIGDFDSSNPPTNIPRLEYQREKDQTDLQLALNRYSADGENSLVIYGAIGNGIDHEITNLLLLHSYPNTVEYRAPDTSIRCITETLTIRSRPRQRISIFSLSKKGAVVTTKGLRWDLQRRQIDHTFYSISNYIEDIQCTIIVEEGTALICSVIET